MRKQIVVLSMIFMFVLMFSHGSVLANGNSASNVGAVTSTSNTQAVSSPNGATLNQNHSSTIKSETFKVTATVPEAFDKTILINFTSQNKQNIVARLDKINGYIFSEAIETGIYDVGFINIVGENANDYDIKAPEQVVIKEGIMTDFPLQISLKPIARTDDKTKSTQPDQQVSSSKEPSLDIKLEGTLKLPVSEGNEEKLASESPVSTPSVALSESMLSGIIGVGTVVLLVLLIFIYKQLRYKHDYYDC